MVWKEIERGRRLLRGVGSYGDETPTSDESRARSLLHTMQMCRCKLYGT